MGTSLPGWLVYVSMFFWDTGLYEIKLMPRSIPTYDACVKFVEKDHEAIINGLAQYMANAGESNYSVLEAGCLIKENFEKDSKDRVLVKHYADPPTGTGEIPPKIIYEDPATQTGHNWYAIVTFISNPKIDGIITYLFTDAYPTLKACRDYVLPNQIALFRKAWMEYEGRYQPYNLVCVRQDELDRVMKKEQIKGTRI